MITGHNVMGVPNEIDRGLKQWSEVFRFFPGELRLILGKIPWELHYRVIEIRLRAGKPLELNLGPKNLWVTKAGEETGDFSSAYIISDEEIKKTINSITAGSFYAVEEEVSQGYITLPGGHRVGFTGHAVTHFGKIRLIRDISSLNFRIAKKIKGIARGILPLLWKDGRFMKTLILSPPAAGKTTLLREIIREFSSGVPSLGISGLHIGLVDERSEIAGNYQGIPQLDVGPRTDVLDACPKKEGVYLLLRAMNPQIIATDEIGKEEDISVIEDIINAGVSFMATAHARNLTEAMFRPGLKKILEAGIVERLIILSHRLGVGTIESVKMGIAGPELLKCGVCPEGFFD